MSNWNDKIIAEFRANDGRVGGQFAGAPMLLVHYVGRKSGRPGVTPTMFLQADDDPNTVYVFASAGGSPTSPAWYYNLVAAGRTTIERGTETYDVTVTELTGADRDRVYAEQAALFPGFVDYERKTAGIRVIPVLALTRI